MPDPAGEASQPAKLYTYMFESPKGKHEQEYKDPQDFVLAEYKSKGPQLFFDGENYGEQAEPSMRWDAMVHNLIQRNEDIFRGPNVCYILSSEALDEFIIPPRQRLEIRNWASPEHFKRFENSMKNWPLDVTVKEKADNAVLVWVMPKRDLLTS